MFLFQLYNQITKQKKEPTFPTWDTSEMPLSWKTTYIKQYERFPLVAFPLPVAIDISKETLFETILGRRSKRTFNNTLTIEQVSTLLYYSVGETDSEAEDGVGRRVYPSGGARYPLEFYIIFLKNVEGITSGVYHYDIVNHGIRNIRKVAPDILYLQKQIGYPFLETATFVIFFTATFSRTSERYKEHAYRLITLEAGAVMQNFSLVAQELGVDSLSVGNLAEAVIEPILDIDGSAEVCIHQMFFG